MSKTKAKAISRKRCGTVAVTKLTGSTPDQILLSKLVEHHQSEKYSVSFVDILKELGMNDRNTKWRQVWKNLESSGYIKASEKTSGGFFTGGFGLTQTGIELAASDEYKATMHESKPLTNEELHKRIKSKLINKRGDQIFDLLLKQGPLSRLELSKTLGISDRGACFSYALQQLKDLKYVEFDPTSKGPGKKLRLSKNAFIAK